MVRTYTDLYAEIADFSNLFLAFRKAARGKRGNPAVVSFEFQLDI